LAESDDKTLAIFRSSANCFIFSKNGANRSYFDPALILLNFEIIGYK